MKINDKENREWADIVEDIRRRGDVGAYGLENYVGKLKLREDTGEKLLLEYPADLPIVWVELNYKECIMNSVVSVIGAARVIEFVPTEEEASLERPQASIPSRQESVAQAPEKPQPPAPQVRRRKLSRKVDTFNSGLNEIYDFESFVVEDVNRFACDAAMAVAEQPGKFNPLFIHGDSGLGKTHLLQAIGNAIRKHDEDARVLYVTSETFTNSYIEALALKADALQSFRRKYRKADVLLIDDVQFLAHKGKTQEEFFHTFNTLFDGGKQIVLTSACPASEVSDLDERLRSRFEQGLSAALHAPAYETRVNILKMKRERMCGELIDDEVLEYLAKTITRSVRRLEGAFTSLSACAALSHRKPTLQEARAQLREIVREEPRTRLVIKDIQQSVADEFHLRVADLNGRRRTANIALPRQIAMFLARHHTACSLKDIGAAFGGRDHGTVIHAAYTVEQRMAEQPELRAAVNRIMATLGI